MCVQVYNLPKLRRAFFNNCEIKPWYSRLKNQYNPLARAGAWKPGNMWDSTYSGDDINNKSSALTALPHMMPNLVYKYAVSWKAIETIERSCISVENT